MSPSWITAFLDLTPDTYDNGVRFWQQVTGYGLSAPRGEGGQFATLVPPNGDAHLRVQRLPGARGRIHLDLHVSSPRLAADRAIGLGGREIADLGHIVMASPGGFVFCFVSEGEHEPAAPGQWPGGHASQVDQVCLDVPAELHDRELVFWTAVTGRKVVPSPGYAEFHRLRRPAGQRLELLVQRLDDPLGEVHGHLDLATTDRASETARHEELGARVVVAREGWTVLTDPAGSAYCLTDRVPAR